MCVIAASQSWHKDTCSYVMTSLRYPSATSLHALSPRVYEFITQPNDACRRGRMFGQCAELDVEVKIKRKTIQRRAHTPISKIGWHTASYSLAQSVTVMSGAENHHENFYLRERTPREPTHRLPMRQESVIFNSDSEIRSSAIWMSIPDKPR